MPSDVVLVTGAAGFIGQRIVARLAADGYAVRAGVFRRQLPEAIAERVSSIPLNLKDPAAISFAVEGANVIVHAAYGATSTMVRELADLLDAATCAGITRFIFFSSIAVYGAQSGQCSEKQRLSATLSGYAAAKAQCETLVHLWAAGDATRRAMIFRPGIVTGAESPFWTQKLVTRINAGVWGTFGQAGEGLAALVDVDDVADAVALCLPYFQHTFSTVSTLHLTGPYTPTWNQYFDEIARAIGAPKLRPQSELERHLRFIAGRLAAALILLKLPGFSKLALAPSSDERVMFALKAHYPAEQAQALLGWHPKGVRVSAYFKGQHRPQA